MTSLIMLAVDPAAESGGYTISVVSILVVFTSLAILVGIFMLIPRILKMRAENKQKQAGVKKNGQAVAEADVNAAIAMALHLYLDDTHDQESNIITIKNARKQYSPWNSKIYGVQNQTMRR